jgi:hypothetical protein
MVFWAIVLSVASITLSWGSLRRARQQDRCERAERAFLGIDKKLTKEMDEVARRVQEEHKRLYD